jgi:hypothetical protein
MLSSLAILSLVVALLSVHESSRFAYFSRRISGSLSTVREFRRAVDNTLDAKSFILHIGDAAIEYQAPNRTRQSDVVGGPDMVIGKMTYWSLGTDNGVVRQWGKEPLTPLIDRFFGPRSAKSALRDLRRQVSVVRRGTVFDVQQVVPAATLVPGDSGQLLIIWSVTTQGGYVERIGGRVHGILPSYFAVGHRSAFVRSAPMARTWYSRIDRVAPITAPPKNKTVKLVPFANPSQFIDGSEYTCGMFPS